MSQGRFLEIHDPPEISNGLDNQLSLWRTESKLIVLAEGYHPDISSQECPNTEAGQGAELAPW